MWDKKWFSSSSCSTARTPLSSSHPNNTPIPTFIVIKPQFQWDSVITLAFRDSWCSSMWSSSELSISSSMPVILPANSGYIRWINGNKRSPSICFCSCGGAAASIVAVRGSCPWMCTAWKCDLKQLCDPRTVGTTVTTYVNKSLQYQSYCQTYFVVRYNQAERKSLNIQNIKKASVLKTMIWHTFVYAWEFISISNFTLITYTMGVEPKTILQDFRSFHRKIGDILGVIYKLTYRICCIKKNTKQVLGYVNWPKSNYPVIKLQLTAPTLPQVLLAEAAGWTEPKTGPAAKEKISGLPEI